VVIARPPVDELAVEDPEGRVDEPAEQPAMMTVP
jgi:hypothetical protein